MESVLYRARSVLAEAFMFLREKLPIAEAQWWVGCKEDMYKLMEPHHLSNMLNGKYVT